MLVFAAVAPVYYHYFLRFYMAMIAGGLMSNGVNFSRTLLKIMCKQAEGLKVCHLNAQSLYPKIDEFRDIFNDSFMDIICISESWLKPLIDKNLVMLNNYKMYRNDRIDRVGGGVAVYVKSSFRTRVIAQSEGGSIEYLFIELVINSEKYLLGTVYKPPNISDTDPLETILSELSHNYPNIIIMGDFNVNLLDQNVSARSFNDLISTYGLAVVNSDPTHFTSTSSTLLDLLIVDDPVKMLFFNQISLPGFSKHDLIFGIYDAVQQSEGEHVFTYRDLNNINYEELFAEAEQMNWALVRSMTSTDDQIEHLTELISYLYDKYVPLKYRRILNTKCPWFTERIR